MNLHQELENARPGSGGASEPYDVAIKKSFIANRHKIFNVDWLNGVSRPNTVSDITIQSIWYGWALCHVEEAGISSHLNLNEREKKLLLDAWRLLHDKFGSLIQPKKASKFDHLLADLQQRG